MRVRASCLRNQALAVESGEGIVHAAHARVALGLHDTRDLVPATLADQVGDGRVHQHDLRRQHATLCPQAGHQHLRHDALERLTQHHADLGLLVDGELVDQAVHRLGCVGGVHGRQDEMPGLGGGDGQLGGLEIPQLPR